MTRDDETEDEDEPGLREMAVDALLEGREEDLAAIGEALEQAWEEFEQNGDRLASNQETSQGVARLDEQVDPKVIDWVTDFCDTDRFGGFMEADVADLPQALARHAEFEPAFLNPDAVWKHNGVSYSIEALLEAWDGVDAVVEACQRPIAAMWRDFVAARAALADVVRTASHPSARVAGHPCRNARELCPLSCGGDRALWSRPAELPRRLGPVARVGAGDAGRDSDARSGTGPHDGSGRRSQRQGGDAAAASPAFVAVSALRGNPPRSLAVPGRCPRATEGS